MEKNWTVSHICIVVRDMDKAVESLQSLGIATIKSDEYIISNDTIADFMIQGKPAPKFKIRARLFQIGSTTFEFIQPIEGETNQMMFLNSQGEGIQHIGFDVDDLEKESAKLVKKGIKVIESGKVVGGPTFYHFAATKIGNLDLQLMQR